MMPKSYIQEAKEILIIKYRSGNPSLCRLDYPEHVWEGMIRNAFLSSQVECVFVRDRDPEAAAFLTERQRVLDENAEVDEVIDTTDSTILSAKDQEISELKARLAKFERGPVAGVQGSPEPNAGSGNPFSKESLMAMEINELRKLAPAFKTLGSGTREDIANRILEQIQKGIMPE